MLTPEDITAERNYIADLRAYADADERAANAIGFGSDKAVGARRSADSRERALDARIAEEAAQAAQAHGPSTLHHVGTTFDDACPWCELDGDEHEDVSAVADIGTDEDEVTALCWCGHTLVGPEAFAAVARYVIRGEAPNVIADSAAFTRTILAAIRQA